jgi:hypothetical protein
MTRDQIVEALQQQDVESTAYWNAFDTDAFFSGIGTGWSPADTIRHLIKSTRPVVKALAMPRLFLRLLFGKARRPSRSYDDLRATYLGALAKGADAGRFAPSQRTETDREAWRTQIMAQSAGVNRDLRAAIARWRDDKLDRCQLPHPLLGKLTVREMLFFTLYHQRHHGEVVKRRLHELAS